MLYSLGSIVRLRQGRFREADQEADQTLVVASEADSPIELSFAHRLLSISLRTQGNLVEALEHCQKSLALCEYTGDLIGQVRNTINLGILQFEQDNWSTAGESYEQAARRECYEETGLEIEIVDEFPAVTHRYAHGNLALRFFRCRVVGEPDRLSSHQGFRWVEKGRLSQFKFPEANQQVVTTLVTGC